MDVAQVCFRAAIDTPLPPHQKPDQENNIAASRFNHDTETGDLRPPDRISEYQQDFGCAAEACMCHSGLFPKAEKLNGSAV